MNRKKGIYVFMTALMLLGMGCTFASCGSDDDDDTQGNREVAELKAMLLDENGQVFFEAMGGSDYKIGLLSKQMSPTGPSSWKRRAKSPPVLSKHEVMENVPPNEPSGRMSNWSVSSR